MLSLDGLLELLHVDKLTFMVSQIINPSPDFQTREHTITNNVSRSWKGLRARREHGQESNE
jgi:hypothetical protein